MSGRKSYRRGRQGEDYAAHWLVEQGYQIRQRNVRVAYGELDLIAEKDGILYFVEVKTRQNGLGQAAESLTPAKRVRMRQAAYGWLSRFYQEEPAACFLIVLLQMDGSGQVLAREMFCSEL